MRYAALLFISLSTICNSQVGIGTTSPAASLDINGDVIIRNIPIETDKNLAKDFLLLTNNGAIKSIPLKDVFNEMFATMVKGNFSSASPINVDLISGPSIIPFDNEEFDVNNEFDTSTYIFTANEAGIYEVAIYTKGNALSIATNYGIRIVKNSTVEHTNSFANVGVASINVTPPTRGIKSYIQLVAGDTIKFELESSLAAISKLDNSKAASYFTIMRVR
jgi:hypothetical protein